MSTMNKVMVDSTILATANAMHTEIQSLRQENESLRSSVQGLMSKATFFEGNQSAMQVRHDKNLTSLASFLNLDGIDNRR
jgi:hypothetical protein